MIYQQCAQVAQSASPQIASLKQALSAEQVGRAGRPMPFRLNILVLLRELGSNALAQDLVNANGVKICSH